MGRWRLLWNQRKSTSSAGSNNEKISYRPDPDRSIRRWRPETNTHTQKKTKENRHPIEKAKTKDCVTDNGGRVTKEEHEFNETLTTANSQSTASQRDRDSLPETAKKNQTKQKTIARLVGGNVLDPSGIRSLSRKFKVTKKKTHKKKLGNNNSVDRFGRCFLKRSSDWSAAFGQCDEASAFARDQSSGDINQRPLAAGNSISHRRPAPIQ